MSTPEASSHQPPVFSVTTHGAIRVLVDTPEVRCLVEDGELVEWQAKVTADPPGLINQPPRPEPCPRCGGVMIGGCSRRCTRCGVTLGCSD